jgi:hypothetical protein
MTYRIIQLHGGAMEVRSDADPASFTRGTTFTIRIPVSPAQTNEARRGLSRAASNGKYPDSGATREGNATNMESKELA